MLKKLQRDSLLLGNCSGPLTGKTLSAVTHTINALTALNYLGGRTDSFSFLFSLFVINSYW